MYALMSARSTNARSIASVMLLVVSTCKEVSEEGDPGACGAASARRRLGDVAGGQHLRLGQGREGHCGAWGAW